VPVVFFGEGTKGACGFFMRGHKECLLFLGERALRVPVVFLVRWHKECLWSFW
jgi:hypothetical protein